MFKKQNIVLDGCKYELLVKKNINKSKDAPRLIIASYLPNKKAYDVLNCCIETIKHFTKINYELWVIDNNSPIDNIKPLFDDCKINLVLNKTNPKINNGSYANAVALEIGISLIDSDSQFVMTLHQDTAVCKDVWLEYLLSKFNNEVKAVGVREDSTRVKEGILHVLGYIIDFQLFKKLDLSFWPDLPTFDVGDKAIVKLKNAGYKIFSTPNTIWNKSYIEKIPEKSPFKNLCVDRSFDDTGDIFFLHLGRGTLKAKGFFLNKKTLISVDEWSDFIYSKVLRIPKNQKYMELKSKVIGDIGISFRRYYVDKFFFDSVPFIPTNAEILDMGGKKKNKRGMFDIEKYTFKVKYANIDKNTDPDYLCDISNVPVPDEYFDCVLLSEVIEHLPNPIEVLKESYRVLKQGGKLFMVTPFMFHVHADPCDYGRYTEYWYSENLLRIGYKSIKVEKQGLFFSVMANMLKLWAKEYIKEHNSSLKKKIVEKSITWFSEKIFIWDNKEYVKNSKVLSSHTTGYGVRCEK